MSKDNRKKKNEQRKKTKPKPLNNMKMKFKLFNSCSICCQLLHKYSLFSWLIDEFLVIMFYM